MKIAIVVVEEDSVRTSRAWAHYDAWISDARLFDTVEEADKALRRLIKIRSFKHLKPKPKPPDVLLGPNDLVAAIICPGKGRKPRIEFNAGAKGKDPVPVDRALIKDGYPVFGMGMVAQI